MRARALVSAITFSLLLILLLAIVRGETLLGAMVAHAGYAPAGEIQGATSLETWESFQPSGWVSYTPVTCTAEVYNAGGFAEDPQYQYRTGGTWSNWTADGLQLTWLDATRRRLTVSNLPFTHSSALDQNQIKFRIKAALGGWLESGAYSVLVDTTAPTSAILISPCYRSAMEVIGTATDSGSGVTLVQVQLQRAADGFYYNGTSWQKAATWMVAAGTANWSLPFVPSLDGVYTVTAKAMDNVGHVQNPPSTTSFHYDATPPQSAITTVGYFRTDTWPGSINGTADDLGFEIASVQIMLQRSLDGYYYNGATASWGAFATYITVSGTTAWSVPFTPSEEAVYTVTSLATDACGNVETVPDTSLFMYDNTPPSSAILTTGCFNVWAGFIHGTATDNVSGVATVEITLQRSSDGLYYNGSSWEAAARWLMASGTTGWSLPFVPTVQTMYLVTSRATDNAGHMQTSYGSGAFMYDATPPGSTIFTTGPYGLIGGDGFRTWPGAIEGSASDALSGVIAVHVAVQRASDGLYYDGTVWSPTPSWITATGTALWTLPFIPAEESVYTVTSRAMDNCGNAQLAFGVSAFSYDATGPSSTPATTGCVGLWTGLIQGTASDAVSGVGSVRVTLQRLSDGLYYSGSSWGPAAAWITASGTTTWSFPFVPTVETVYTVTSQATDRSGNVQSVPGTGAFTYDLTPPQSTITTTGCLLGGLGPIQGAASDALSGVASVQIKLQRAVDGLYYNGTSWVGNATWILATGTTSWYVPFVPTVQTLYTVTSSAIDRCGNAQTNLAVSTFSHDADPPSSQIGTTGYYKVWTVPIQGTAHDAASGIGQIEVRLQRGSDQRYYDGASWTPLSYWIPVSWTIARTGSGWDASWALPFTPTVQAAYTIEAKATDPCGNAQTAPSMGSFVWDLTAPLAPVSLLTQPVQWTSTNAFTVTWSNPPDLAGIDTAHFKWNTAPTSNADESSGSPVIGDAIQSMAGITVPIEGAHQLFLWLEDKADNVNYQNRNATSAGAFKWDSTAPSTTVSAVDARKGCSGWFVSAVEVSLQAADTNSDPRVTATSGISATLWRKDGGDWQQVVASKLQVSDQGSHVVEYYSVDVAGNVERSHVVSPTLKIDSVPPATSPPSFTGTLGPNQWYRSGVSVTLTALDATSGVSVTYHQVNTGTVEPGDSFYIAADGMHAIRYYSVDAACNQESVYTATLKIDQTPPRTVHQLSGRLGENGWFAASPVTVTLSASDVVTGVLASSGVDKVRYRFDGGPWQEAQSTASFALALPSGQKEGARTVEYYATDLAGNAEQPVHTLIVGMDSQAPATLPFSPYSVPSGWTNSNCFDIRWIQNPEDFSGIGGAYYSFQVPVSNTDGTLYLADYLTSIPCVQVPSALGDGVYNVYVWLRDRAGNSDYRTRNSAAVALDRNPPRVTALITGAACGETGWYNSPITVTCVATDDLSGMASGIISYQVNGGGWITGTSYSESHDGRHVVECRATDTAGNTSEPATTLVRLDRTAPETPTPIWVEPSDWSRDKVFTVRWVNPGDLSGLAGAYYKLGSPPTGPTDGTYVDGVQASLPISATIEGPVPVYVWLVDKACNSNHEQWATATLKYDRTAPTTTFSSSGTVGTNGWYVSSVLVTMSCADSYSGCGPDSIRYRIADGLWQSGNSFSVEADGSTPFSYYSVDLAGNAGSALTATIKIDRTPPASYAYSDGYSPSPSFTVRWDGSDAISGIDTFDVQYRVGIGGSWQPWVSGVDQKSKLFLDGVAGKVYYFRTRARDKAGNVETYPTTPDTYVSVDPLTNGDFERDLAVEWATQAVCPVRQEYAPSYSGGNTRVVVLGCPDQKSGAPFGESMICQTINVPSAQDMSALTLRFRYHIFTYDVLWGEWTLKYYDSFNVGLSNPGQMSPTYVFTDGNRTQNVDTLMDLGWQEGSVDLTFYAGRTIQVCLANVTRVDTDYNTWTLVDDVRLVHLAHRIALPIVQRVRVAQVSAAESPTVAQPDSQQEERSTYPEEGVRSTYQKGER